MRPGDREEAKLIAIRLAEFSDTRQNLLGIQEIRCRDALVEQIIESLRRVRYVAAIRNRDVSDRRTDPNDEFFDPLKAAIVFDNQGLTDEAFWMVFLFVHFGKHKTGGWRFAREVYGRLGDGGRWDWAATSVDPDQFREWLEANEARIKRPSDPGGFGNHRKYESLNAWGNNGTGATFATYVQWVRPPRTHGELFGQALEEASGDPREAFRRLYLSMRGIARFGRVARFDYLAMVGKLGLSDIEPNSTHLAGSTGPLSGAHQLLGDAASTSQLEAWLVDLEGHLGVGMQVLEDALCNWQKNPEMFIPFRG